MDVPAAPSLGAFWILRATKQPHKNRKTPWEVLVYASLLVSNVPNIYFLIQMCFLTFIDINIHI